MKPRIEPHANQTFGATITDIDLANLDAATWRVVEDAFHEYAALVFPGQFPSVVDQVAFGRRFGNLEYLRDGQESVQISNVRADGTVLDSDEFRFKTLRGNEGWHHDSTYMPLAAKVGLLSAITVPENGGETELADMRAGYDVLDENTRQRIAGLSAYHSLYASQAKIGYRIETGSGYGFHTKGAPLRPLVKIHPVTGRKALCIGRHAYRIEGMDDEAAQALLDELLDLACRPPRVYTHHWTAGDLLIWDNRCVLHRACPYDVSKARVLQATRIAGDHDHDLAVTARDHRASDFQPSSVNR